MSWLPKDHTVESYITSCLTLLEKWNWLFRDKTIDILKSGQLDEPFTSNTLACISEIETCHLNEVPYGFLKEEWPNELKDFIKECCLLKLNVQKIEVKIPDISRHSLLGMKSKKQEEVLHMSSLVADICFKHNIRHVVDFGSGLGHVDRILASHFGLDVLGLEKDKDKVTRAKQICNSVEYRTSCLNKDSISEVHKEITDWLCGSSTCFIALHPCGDLSVHVTNLFSEMNEAKILIMIPCCYHLSKSRPLCEEVKNSHLVNTNLLRLASEGTAERWRQSTAQSHYAHARSLLARALVQLVPSQGSNSLKKKHRHLLRAKEKNNSAECLEKCLNGFSGVNEDELRLQWENNEWRINQVEAYSCLQTCLQGVAEGLVLADTYLYAKKKTHANIELIRIFDVLISPRSLAFVLVS